MQTCMHAMYIMFYGTLHMSNITHVNKVALPGFEFATADLKTDVLNHLATACNQSQASVGINWL